MPPWSVAPPRQVVEPPARYRMATGVKEDAERRRCAKRIATKLSNRLHRTQARVLIDGLVLALRETRERGVEIADFLAGHDGHEASGGRRYSQLMTAPPVVAWKAEPFAGVALDSSMVRTFAPPESFAWM